MADTPFSTTAVVTAPTNQSSASHAAFATILGQLEEAVLLEQLTLGGVGDPAMSGLEDDTVTAWDACETALAQFVADPTARPFLPQLQSPCWLCFAFRVVPAECCGAMSQMCESLQTCLPWWWVSRSRCAQ